MKKNFIFEKDKDISTKHIFFEKLENYSLRNTLRDIFDEYFRKPYYFFKYKNFFKYQDYKIDFILPSKGFSHKSRREKLNQMKKINGKSILNIGCGNAFDYHLWFRYMPKKIVGIDLLNYKNSWDSVLKYVKKKNVNIEIKFYKKDFNEFNSDEKFDFIVSDAVFEHCKDLKNVIKKCHKFLKDDGIMYASYGPIWFSYGGDHFSGRDNIKNGYNHLILEKKDYQKYFNFNVGSFDYEVNQGGAGGILVKNDLFSKLLANEYFEIFKQNNFHSEFTCVEHCPIGYELIKKDSLLKKKLLSKYKTIHPENFFLKSHIVYLKKI